jgi:hypothetical protein
MICMTYLKKLFPYQLTFVGSNGESKTGYPVYGEYTIDGNMLIEIKNGKGREFVTKFTKIMYGKRNVKDQVIRAIMCAYVLSLAYTLLPHAAPLHDFTHLIFFRRGIGL